MFRKLLMSRARRAPFIGAAAVGCFASCTPFEPGTDQLGPDAQLEMDIAAEQPGPAQSATANMAAGTGMDWSCLSDEDELGPLVASPLGAPRLVKSLRVLSLATGEILAGVTVRACAQRDIDCAEPLTAAIPTDANGWVDLPLYEGFDGYLEITGDTIVSTALFYADPLESASQADRTPLGLLEKELLPSLSGATGQVQDRNLGLVYLRTFDCQGDAAPGVTFTIDKPAWQWYFVDGLPSSMAEETAADSGLGGFINVPPGIAVVNAVLPGAERPIARPKSVLVRADWMTGLRFIPTPEQ